MLCPPSLAGAHHSAPSVRSPTPCPPKTASTLSPGSSSSARATRSPAAFRALHSVPYPAVHRYDPATAHNKPSAGHQSPMAAHDGLGAGSPGHPSMQWRESSLNAREQQRVTAIGRYVEGLQECVQSPQATAPFSDAPPAYHSSALPSGSNWATLAVPRRPADDDMSSVPSTAQDITETLGTYSLSTGRDSPMDELWDKYGSAIMSQTVDDPPAMSHGVHARSPTSAPFSFQSTQETLSFDGKDSGYQGSPDTGFESSFGSTLSKLDEPLPVSVRDVQHIYGAGANTLPSTEYSCPPLAPAALPGVFSQPTKLTAAGRETIETRIMGPMIRNRKLEGAIELLRSDLSRLKAGEFQCLRDLDEHFLQRSSGATSIFLYMSIYLEFLALCRTTVLDEKLFTNSDLYRSTDRILYSSDYFLFTAPKKLFANAIMAYGKSAANIDMVESFRRAEGAAHERDRDPCSSLVPPTSPAIKRQSPNLDSTRRSKKSTPADAKAPNLPPAATSKAGRRAATGPTTTLTALNPTTTTATTGPMSDNHHHHQGSYSPSKDIFPSHVISPTAEASLTLNDMATGGSFSYRDVQRPVVDGYPTSHSAEMHPGRSPGKTKRSPQRSPKGPSASRRTLQGGFQCTVPSCQRTFARACDLRKHNKTHVRPHKCSVKSCKFHEIGFSAEKDRDRHYNDKHSPNVKKFPCHYQPCEYTSPRESNVKQHMEKSHGYVYERSKWNPKSNPSKTSSSSKGGPGSTKPLEPPKSVPENATGDGASLGSDGRRQPQPCRLNTLMPARDAGACSPLTPESAYHTPHSHPNSAASTLIEVFTPGTQPSYSPELPFFPPLDSTPDSSPAMLHHHSPMIGGGGSRNNSFDSPVDSSGYRRPVTLSNHLHHSQHSRNSLDMSQSDSSHTTSQSPEIHVSYYDSSLNGHSRETTVPASLFDDVIGASPRMPHSITQQYAEEFLQDLPMCQQHYLGENNNGGSTQAPPQPTLNSEGYPIVQENLYNDELDRQFADSC